MVRDPQLETIVTPRQPPGTSETGVTPAGGSYHLETVVIPRKPRHLEFIQQAIDRMESNSILLKGWTIILSATLLGVFSDDPSTTPIFVLCLPVLGFWILDGTYQSQERCLRSLYDRIRDKAEGEIDFSMDISEERLDIRNRLLSSTILSPLGLFYVPVILIILAIGGLLSV